MKILNKILFTLLMIFLFLPLLSMFIWAIFSSWGPNDILPSKLTLKWFTYFFSSGDWIIGVKSVLFSIIAGFISLVLSIMLSRFFIKSNFKYKEQLESMFYLPMLLPVVSVCIGSHKMLLNILGMRGSFMVLILHIYFSLPYAFRMVYSFYCIWGIEQEQIARGLGANRWQAFSLINIPVYFNSYISSFIMAFIISYSQYFVNFFIGDYNSVNFSMIMTPYITNSNRNIASVYIFLYILYGIIVMALCALIEKKYNNRKRNELI